MKTPLELSRITGYSTRQIRRFARYPENHPLKIPGRYQTAGGQDRFKECQALTNWIQARKSKNTQVGKALADASSTMRNARRGPGLLLIEGIVGRLELWVRNILLSGKIQRSAKTIAAVEREVVGPLRAELKKIEEWKSGPKGSTSP